MRDPLASLREVSPDDGVVVAVSGGKDSVAALDLCCQHFRRVDAYHLYVVPGIGFVEQYLQFLERRYRISIHRTPSPSLARYLRDGMFRARTLNVPLITHSEIEAGERRRTGARWIANGMKKWDSIFRRGMISGWGAVATRQGKLFPLADWSEAQVYRHLRQRSVPLSPTYAVFGYNWDSDLGGRSLAFIRQRWPADYAKIKQMFPLCDTEADRWELLNGSPKISTNGTGFVPRKRGARKPAGGQPGEQPDERRDTLPEVSDGEGPASAVEPGPLQSPDD